MQNEESFFLGKCHKQHNDTRNEALVQLKSQNKPFVHYVVYLLPNLKSTCVQKRIES